LSLVLLSLAINYRRYRGTGNKFIAGMVQAINEKPCQNVFTDVMDTYDKFIASIVDTTLYRKPDLCIRRNETAGPHINSYVHVSVSHLYIPRIGLPIWLQQNRLADPGNM
jgi:hypothetical protein